MKSRLVAIWTQKNRYVRENKVKQAFSRFGSARNRFLAWFYSYIGHIEKKIFGEWPQMVPPLSLAFLGLGLSLDLRDQSSNLQPYEKMIYSKNSRKMEHFFLLRYSLKKFPFRDIRVWKLRFLAKKHLKKFANYNENM